MNAGVTIGMLLVAAGAAGAAKKEVNTPQTATVCMDSPAPEVPFAKLVTSGMFGEIGVKIRWVDYKNCPAGAVRINFRTRSDSSLEPGAMAYSLPYGRVDVFVLYDRILSKGKDLQPYLLAHVLAHEITHVLQGIAQHSEQGLMKKAWTAVDYGTMLRKHTLSFTIADQELIHAGIGFRSARLAADTSVSGVQ